MQIRTAFFLIQFLLITFSINSQVNLFDSKKYSVEELQEDFKYLRTQIQKKGTVIYLYNTKKKTDQYLDSIYSCIKEPMTDIEFFRLIAPVQAFFKDVHTGIFPSTAIRKTFFENHYLFPLYIELIEDKVYIEENLSSNSNVSFHQEIISINGIPIETIVHTCSLMLPRDGYDNGQPLFYINRDFSYYFYFIYGPSESYQLELKTKKGVTQTEVVQGKSLKAIWEVDDQLHPFIESRNIYTHYNDSLKTAILTLNTFGDKTIKENHKASFGKLIRAEFDTILKTGYPNLIIDVRDNDGGNSGDGKKVMKYILKTSFEMKKSVRVVKNKNEEDLMKRTRPALNGQFQRGTYKPHKRGFDGDVYVLVNGGSTSAAVVFAATLKRNKRVTFVGIEMGGNPIVMGGALWDNVKSTPNTKISFMYGNKLNILDNLELNTGHGLIPDHVIENSYEDFISGKDSQMLFTLKLIEKKL